MRKLITFLLGTALTLAPSSLNAEEEFPIKQIKTGLVWN